MLYDMMMCVVQVWLQYQSLWDMEPANIYGRLESDLTKWQKLLMDIKLDRDALLPPLPSQSSLHPSHSLSITHPFPAFSFISLLFT